MFSVFDMCARVLECVSECVCVHARVLRTVSLRLNNLSGGSCLEKMNSPSLNSC